MDRNPIPAEKLSAYDASAITDQLFIAVRPHARHVPHLTGLGIDLVVSTIWFAPPRELMRPPFRLVRLPMIDSPLFPIPIRLLKEAVDAAVPVLDAGGKVLVYCMAGRHRSVATTCCILIARGMTADEAMALVIERRPIADPHARYIERRIRLFEQEFRSGGP